MAGKGKSAKDSRGKDREVLREIFRNFSRVK